MEIPRIVTTSWDDGDRLDLRVAETLYSRGISGTFYVPIQPYGGRPALTHPELRNLAAEGFEIGAHGFSHKHLWNLPAQELADEVNPCKPMLEDILGGEVRMFCYPRGRFDANVVRALKEAGYQGARTVQMLATGLQFDPFEMPTTLQAAPHTRFNYVKNIARAKKPARMQTWMSQARSVGNWVELGKKLFDSVLEQGGIWHLYGHSWEIDELGLWKDFENLADYVGSRKGVSYVPNWKLIPLTSTQTTRQLEEMRTHENHPCS